MGGGDDYGGANPPESQNLLATWAVVEILGHQKYAGYVAQQAFGGDVMIRLDVPDLPERLRILEKPTYVQLESGESQYAPIGTEIKAGPVPGYTKLFGVKAIYCITPCTETAARAVIDQLSARPLMLVKLPGARAELPAPVALATETRATMAPYVFDDED